MVPPSWNRDAPAKIRYFSQKIFGAVWPGTLPDLERALQTFSIALDETMGVFLQHAEEERGKKCGVKFYKSDRYFPPYFKDADGRNKRRQFLESKFDEWLKSYRFFMVEVVKSANWLADIIRRDINPSFCAARGRFLVHYDDQIVLYTYTPDEQIELPNKLMQEIEENSYKFNS